MHLELGEDIFEGARVAWSWKNWKKIKKFKKSPPSQTFNIDFSIKSREAKDAELNFLPQKFKQIWAATPRKKVMLKKPPKI